MKPASLIKRVIVSIIDTVIVLILIYLIFKYSAFSYLIKGSKFYKSWSFWLVFLALYLIISIVYYGVLISKLSTTLAGFIFNVHIKKKDGTNLTFTEAVKRWSILWLTPFVSIFIWIPQLMLSYKQIKNSKLGQAYHDEKVDAVVIEKEGI